MKRAALINDISGMGKCSLVADISVLTAMGVEACPYPAAVLNAQTGFAGYVCRDMTDTMRTFTDGWQEMGLSFDGILTGFLMSEKQAEEVIRFTDIFYKENVLLLVDPVMADHGMCYANYSEGLLEAMKILAEKADIVTPNVSELCLLVGKSFTGVKEPEDLVRMARSLLNKKKKIVIVTGIGAEISGAGRIGNLIVAEDGEDFLTFPAEGGSYSGTGDLFAAAILGGILNKRTCREAVQTAGEFIGCAVKSAAERNVPGMYGTDYERFLTMLR